MRKTSFENVATVFWCPVHLQDAEDVWGGEVGRVHQFLGWYHTGRIYFSGGLNISRYKIIYQGGGGPNNYFRSRVIIFFGNGIISMWWMHFWSFICLLIDLPRAAKPVNQHLYNLHSFVSKNATKVINILSKGFVWGAILILLWF